MLSAECVPSVGEERPEKELWFEISGREGKAVGVESPPPPPATLRRCSPVDISDNQCMPQKGRVERGRTVSRRFIPSL